MSIFDVDDASVRRLDAFEGEYYKRTGVTVALDGEGKVVAQAYVIRGEFEDLLFSHWRILFDINPDNPYY